MDTPFEQFERRIRRVAEAHPEMPAGSVTLTRMFFYVSRALEESANRFLAAYGLNNTHYTALVIVYASEGHTLNPCALSESLSSSRANVTRLIDELAARGWVERRGSTEDRRRIDISLTQSGLALVEEILPRSWERTEHLWSGFSSEETDFAGRVLRKLLMKIERQKTADEDSCQT